MGPRPLREQPLSVSGQRCEQSGSHNGYCLFVFVVFSVEAERGQGAGAIKGRRDLAHLVAFIKLKLAQHGFYLVDLRERYGLRVA